MKHAFFLSWNAIFVKLLIFNILKPWNVFKNIFRGVDFRLDYDIIGDHVYHIIVRCQSSTGQRCPEIWSAHRCSRKTFQKFRSQCSAIRKVSYSNYDFSIFLPTQFQQASWNQFWKRKKENACSWVCKWTSIQTKLRIFTTQKI